MYQPSMKDSTPTPSRSAGWSRVQSERVLFWLLAVMGFLAATCGVLLIATDGLGMSRTDLEHSPFDSFLIPGLLLTIVVGGSQLAAAQLLRARSSVSELPAIGAGAALLGWILVEAVMVRNGRGLQAFIFAYAVAEIAVSIHLLRADSPNSGDRHDQP